MRYFAGNSLAAFFRSQNTINESASAGRFNASFVSSSLSFPSMVGYAQTSAFSATGTIWVRFDVFTAGGLENASGFGPTLNGPLGPVFRFYCVGVGIAGGTYRPQYWDGTAWTNTGADFVMTNSALLTVTVKIILGSGFQLYVAGTPVSSGSGWVGSPTQAVNFQLHSMNHQTEVNYSQLMIADYDLRDSHFMTRTLNGDSTFNTGAFSGSYTDINELVLNEATAVSITVSGNKAGQTKAALTVPMGLIIGAMVINARGRAIGVITDGKLGVRSGGGINSSGSGLVYNSGYEPRGRIIPTDPDTGLKFTQTGFNNAEIYEEAV